MPRLNVIVRVHFRSVTIFGEGGQSVSEIGRNGNDRYQLPQRGPNGVVSFGQTCDCVIQSEKYSISRSTNSRMTEPFQGT